MTTASKKKRAPLHPVGSVRYVARAGFKTPIGTRVIVNEARDVFSYKPRMAPEYRYCVWDQWFYEDDLSVENPLE